MANNVNITEGSGRTVATDEVSSVSYQVVKLADGTEDSTARIPGDATNGLYVNPRRRLIRVQVTPTISSGAAYASGDCIGGLQTIAAASSYTGGGGRIVGITVLDKTQAQRAAMDILFYSQSVTQAGDNNAFAPSDADQVFCVTGVSLVTANYFAAFPGTPLNSIATHPAPSAGTTSVQTALLPYVCAATSLFAQPIVRGTPTYGSTSDLVFSYLLEPD